MRPSLPVLLMFVLMSRVPYIVDKVDPLYLELTRDQGLGDRVRKLGWNQWKGPRKLSEIERSSR